MDLVRERAPWMTDIDDRILETLAVYDGLRLYPLHQRLVREGIGEPPVTYVLLRCKRLRESRLMIQRDGYFRLTEMGRAYLDGDVDVAMLTHDCDKPDDEERHVATDEERRPPNDED